MKIDQHAADVDHDDLEIFGDSKYNFKKDIKIDSNNLGFQLYAKEHEMDALPDYSCIQRLNVDKQSKA